jgi:hypothetical protein
MQVMGFFTWDERKPGFFEIDSASRCGADVSDEFCSTLALIWRTAGSKKSTRKNPKPPVKGSLNLPASQRQG